MTFPPLRILSPKEVARDRREHLLPIIRERCTPLPAIPAGEEFAILDRRQRADLLGRLRRSQRRCSYCGCSAKRGDLDHMVPRSRGGCHSRTNLALSCQSCNRGKGARTATEYIRALLGAARRLRQRLRGRSPVAA